MWTGDAVYPLHHHTFTATGQVFKVEPRAAHTECRAKVQGYGTSSLWMREVSLRAAHEGLTPVVFRL